GIGLILLIRKFSWGLYLFENGFVFAAGKDRVVLWDDVAQLFEKQDVVAGMRADKWLRLVLKDGSEVKMDSAYKDFSAFNEVLTNKVAEAVLQRAIAALSRDELVSFDKVTVSRSGLEKEEQKLLGTSRDSIGWAELDSVAVELRQTGHAIANSIVI